MELLILGGSVFLGRHLVEAARGCVALPSASTIAAAGEGPRALLTAAEILSVSKFGPTTRPARPEKSRIVDG